MNPAQAPAFPLDMALQGADKGEWEFLGYDTTADGGYRLYVYRNRDSGHRLVVDTAGKCYRYEYMDRWRGYYVEMDRDQAIREATGRLG